MEIAVTAGGLPEAFPGDPADRLIAATAIQYRAPLVTRDHAIRRAGVVRAIW